MSKIPDVDKAKYNKDDKFSWVDSQWEKFMTEQKEMKEKIEKLERKVKKYKILYKTTKKDLKDIIKRTPSKFLTESKKPKWTQKQIAYWDKMIQESIKHTRKLFDLEQEKSSERSDEWRIEQFNRNRAPEEQVHSIQEMSDRVSDLFPEHMTNKSPGFTEQEVKKWKEWSKKSESKKATRYIYESPDGGKTLYRREFGKSDKEKISG